MRELGGSGAVTVLPRPADIERCRTGIERWIEAADGENPQTAASVRGLLAKAAPRRLAEAIFGNSPFLTRIVEADPAYAVRVFEDEFEDLLAEVANDLETHGGDTPAEVKRALRIAKHRVALVIAANDIVGTRDTAVIARALSDFADTAIRVAVRHLLRRLARAGTIRLGSEADPEVGSGLIVLGLGKLGARELNYSSDVDLIVFYDRDAIESEKPDQIQRAFVTLARDLVALLSERTEDGYVFRIDLRLRPDPGATPVALSVEAAET